jgi:hypothetical protein
MADAPKRRSKPYDRDKNAVETLSEMVDPSKIVVVEVGRNNL